MTMSRTPDEVPTIEGERTTTPVSGPALDDKRALVRRGIAVTALIAFGALFIWGSWGRSKASTDDKASKPVVRLNTAYEAPRDPEPIRVQAPVQEAALIAPLRPVASAPRANGDDLLDSARRAPLLIYSRPPQNRSGQGRGTEAAGTDPVVTGSVPYGYEQPKQRNELADKLVATPLEGVRASRLRNRHLVVTQGTAIPCVLETAMSSDVAGFVSCVVERDVMSDSGSVVLMEKGTQVVGEYRGNVRRGSKRMFVLWSRAKTPHGVIVNLASPATDSLGRSGFDGQIDNHFWERFGGALLLSIVNDGSRIAGQQLSKTDIEINSTQGSGNSAAAIATEQSINIPPTLTKNQGELVSIFVARDLDFSSVYDLRLVGQTQAYGRSLGPVFKP